MVQNLNRTDEVCEVSAFCLFFSVASAWDQLSPQGDVREKLGSIASTASNFRKKLNENVEASSPECLRLEVCGGVKNVKNVQVIQLLDWVWDGLPCEQNGESIE